MPETPPNNPTPQPTDHESMSERMREQQAIAAAMMLGEQARREGRSDLYFYAKRLGLATAALGLAGLAMLFAYALLNKGEASFLLPMLGLAVLTAAGCVAAYWGHTEANRGDD